MEVILHFGAHRCATTSFQAYLACNAAALDRQGVAFWGPEITRETALRALKSITPQDRAALNDKMDKLQAQGTRRLIISDENFLGFMRQNLMTGELYPDATQRARMVADVFGNRVSGIALNIRALNTYWVSVLAYAERNKTDFGPHIRWAKFAQHPRSWREVVTDLAQVFPEIPLYVLPFEDFAGHPDAQLGALLDMAAPQAGADIWLGKDRKASVDGPNGAQEFRLMAKFADDLSWLAAGGDGLARLCVNQETAGGESAAFGRMDERKSQ